MIKIRVLTALIPSLGLSHPCVRDCVMLTYFVTYPSRYEILFEEQQAGGGKRGDNSSKGKKKKKKKKKKSGGAAATGESKD